MPKVFTCHGVEWFTGDTCAFCEVVTEEQERIIELIENELVPLGGKFLTERDKEVIKQAVWTLTRNLVASIKGQNK